MKQIIEILSECSEISTVINRRYLRYYPKTLGYLQVSRQTGPNVQPVTIFFFTNTLTDLYYLCDITSLCYPYDKCFKTNASRLERCHGPLCELYLFISRSSQMSIGFDYQVVLRDHSIKPIQFYATYILVGKFISPLICFKS